MLVRMKTSVVSEYYGKRPDDVVIPETWERIPVDWFRKPLQGECYVSKLELPATFTGGPYQVHPERVIIRESKS